MKGTLALSLLGTHASRSQVRVSWVRPTCTADHDHEEAILSADQVGVHAVADKYSNIGVQTHLRNA